MARLEIDLRYRGLPLSGSACVEALTPNCLRVSGVEVLPVGTALELCGPQGTRELRVLRALESSGGSMWLSREGAELEVDPSLHSEDPQIPEESCASESGVPEPSQAGRTEVMSVGEIAAIEATAAEAMAAAESLEAEASEPSLGETAEAAASSVSRGDDAGANDDAGAKKKKKRRRRRRR